MSPGERILRVLDHLGVGAAHFGMRAPADILDLVTRAPKRAASLLMQGGGQVKDFDPYAGRTLWLLGDSGSTAGRMKRQLAERKDVAVRWLESYPEFIWSNTIADRKDEVASAALGLFERFDRENDETETPHPVSLSTAGEVAEVTYEASGTGTPVVLLPLGLSARQWGPLLAQLQERHCTIVLGGRHLQPVENLEARADSGYGEMALNLLGMAAPAPGDAVIEVGCGTGALLRRIASSTGFPRVVGLDVNSFLLGEAKALAASEGLADRLDLREGSAEEIPFPDASFDISFSSTVMEELDADRMMAEMVRITKPGGRVVVAVRAIDRPQWTNLGLSPSLKEKFENAGGAAGRAESGCADESLYRRFSAAGLKGVRGGPSWAWVQTSESYWNNLESQNLALMSPDEANEWRQARAAAKASGHPVWIARPFHSAIGTK